MDRSLDASQSGAPYTAMAGTSGRSPSWLSSVAKPRKRKGSVISFDNVVETVAPLGPLEEHRFASSGEEGVHLILRLPGRDAQLAPLADLAGGVRPGGVGDGGQRCPGAGAPRSRATPEMDGEPGTAGVHQRGAALTPLPRWRRSMAAVAIASPWWPMPNGGRDIPDVRLSDHSPFWDAEST
jgi:hypothetical protein